MAPLEPLEITDPEVWPTALLIRKADESIARYKSYIRFQILVAIAFLGFILLGAWRHWPAQITFTVIATFWLGNISTLWLRTRRIEKNRRTAVERWNSLVKDRPDLQISGAPQDPLA